MNEPLRDLNDPEIAFGEVETVASSSAHPRPDTDANLDILAFGEETRTSFRIYLQSHALVDMTHHVCSDSSIELGGILLGHYWESDAETPDRPRIVSIQEIIRGEQFEATHSSFKFTHATWQAIAREQQLRYPHLQIVGWYHSHPGWGIFLSSMDQFICQNFFQHWFDVAIVIDPLQKEIGVFCWDDEQSREEMIRTEHFLIIRDNMS